ncbi:hypothetical protein DFP73DRAFT_50785 [Morchella snyderi]|nr:hypothetical protein DFP73DRAFT_50785 [Morchella snyderi]
MLYFACTITAPYVFILQLLRPLLFLTFSSLMSMFGVLFLSLLFVGINGMCVGGRAMFSFIILSPVSYFKLNEYFRRVIDSLRRKIKKTILFLVVHYSNCIQPLVSKDGRGLLFVHMPPLRYCRPYMYMII